jgi:hypothetical protein
MYWYYVYYQGTDAFGSSTSSVRNIALISSSQDTAKQYCEQANRNCKGNPFYWVEVVAQ